ncbi:MAG: ECF transporter S component, partial [Clostridia bacterium]|nr:ECF transporter S component [Clostridia bacterium]
GKKGAINFNLAQAIAHAGAWIVIAPILDILIYQEPANKVFIQGGVSALSNIITTAIVGTLLCFAWAKAVPDKGSLKKEN